MARGLIKLKKNGAWKILRSLSVKKNGIWVPAKTAWIKNGGTWKQVYPTPGAAPVFSPTSLSFSTYTDVAATSQRLTITNTGTEVLQVFSITPSSTAYNINIDRTAFGVGTVLIYPGQAKYIDVSILGSTVCTAEPGSIIFKTNIGQLGDQTYTVNIAGTLMPKYATCEVDKSSFSLIYDQTAPTQIITISNKGNKILENLNFAGPSWLTIVGVAPLTCPANGSVTVTFAATTITGNRDYQNYNDLITIRSTARNGDVSITTSIKIYPHGTLTYTADSTFTVPVGIRNNVTIDLKGANGGTGGNDAKVGAPGVNGQYYKVTAAVAVGYTIQVRVGTNGSNGVSAKSSAAGGAGGANSLSRGTGGAGSAAGPSGSSGGGGGGGAATIVRIMTAPGLEAAAIYAGGGGGGGGGGLNSVGIQNTTSTGGRTDTTGGPGATKTGDGGGNGGGGGGATGGLGGPLRSGDVGGNGGYSGTSGVVTILSAAVTVAQLAAPYPTAGQPYVTITW